MQIDPETGLAVFDPSTDPSTTGTTLTTNPLRGFGGASATPMRGPQPKFPWGGGAAPATPMRGPKPTFPYPDPNSFNPIQPAGGPDAPTNSWFQRPSGQPGNGAPALGDVDSPGGGYGGGAQSGGPWQTGPGRSPSGWSGPDSGGIGSDARFPTANYGPAHAGGTPTGPIIPDQGDGLSIWDRIRNMMPGGGNGAAGNVGQQIADAGAIEGGNPAVSQSVDSGNNPAPTLPQPGPFGGGGGGGGGIGSDARFPLTGGGGRPSGRAPPLVNLGHGAPGAVAPHPALARAAARASAGNAPPGLFGQQANSPFTMVLRPNAPAESGGRGQGGTPLSTALDLSGWRPPAAAAAPAPVRTATAPARRAPVRGPLAPGALAPTPGQGAPATGGPGPEDPSIIARQRMRMPKTPADYGDQSWLYGNQPPM
jgi:hypothetical protein